MPWWGWVLVAWGVVVAFALALMKTAKRSDEQMERMFASLREGRPSDHSYRSALDVNPVTVVHGPPGDEHVHESDGTVRPLSDAERDSGWASEYNGHDRHG